MCDTNKVYLEEFETGSINITEVALNTLVVSGPPSGDPPFDTATTPGVVALFQGDIDVEGNIDPLSVVFSQQPGASPLAPPTATDTVMWVDTTTKKVVITDTVNGDEFLARNSQDAYDHSAAGEVVVGANGAAKVRDAAAPLGANLFEVTDFTGATPYFEVTATESKIGGNLEIAGNLNVMGNTTSTSSNNVLIADRYICLNKEYTSDTPVTGGVVVNYDPDPVTASTTITSFTTTTTITVASSAGFAAGQIILVEGANDVDNNGIYEVSSTGAGTITIASVPDATVDGIAKTYVNTDGTAAGSVTLVAINIIRSSTTGEWESGAGSTVPITFTPLGGVDEFIELIDTPAAYAGAANRVLAVNTVPDGVLFSFNEVGTNSGDGSGVAFGSSSSVGAFTDAVAIAGSASAGAASAIAIGGSTSASAASTTAVGAGSSATVASASAFGESASATASSSTAIGSGASASGVSAVSMGDGARAATLRSIAIGEGAVASTSTAPLAIGDSAICSGASAAAIGEGAGAAGDNAYAYGSSASAGGNRSVAIGNSASAGVNDSIAIGDGAATTVGINTIAIGDSSAASATGATAMGGSTSAAGDDSVVLGTGSFTTAAADDSVAIGNAAECTVGTSSIAIGTSTASSAASCTAVGAGATASAGSGTAIGTSANAGGANAASLGSGADASGARAVAVGNAANAIPDESIAVGDGATVPTGALRSVAIGNASVITGASTDCVALGDGTGIGSGAATDRAVAIGDSASVGTVGAADDSLAIGASANVASGSASIALGAGAQCDVSNCLMTSCVPATNNTSGASTTLGTSAWPGAKAIVTSDVFDLTAAPGLLFTITLPTSTVMLVDNIDVVHVAAADTVSVDGAYSVGGDAGAASLVPATAIGGGAENALYGRQSIGALASLVGTNTLTATITTSVTVGGGSTDYNVRFVFEGKLIRTE